MIEILIDFLGDSAKIWLTHAEAYNIIIQCDDVS